MKETTREKSIRLLLIGMCVLVVWIGFSSTSKQVKTSENAPKIQAQVLTPLESGANPLVAIGKTVQEQSVLIIYEIDKGHDYFFKVRHSVTLKKNVKNLMLHERGILVQLDHNQWILFSESLEVLEELKKAPKSTYSNAQSFHYNKSKQSVGIDTKESGLIHLDLPEGKKEEPISIYPLAVDHSLWLVLFEESVVIAKSE
ncbi:hypothetical protein [Rossellomorea aquimaris]|uniref:hypothetical protein n=1 Tax=Rossellomorea aquimaris TaxID=189382 RepID=UPI0007D0A7B4|nr:hypothetical protein [Rossellomorea aquimaris]